MKVKTNVKVGGRTVQHNEALTKDKGKTKAPSAGLKVRTRIKAGARRPQHNEALVRDRR